jgi:hypothetical protein
MEFSKNVTFRLSSFISLYPFSLWDIRQKSSSYDFYDFCFPKTPVHAISSISHNTLGKVEEKKMGGDVSVNCRPSISSDESGHVAGMPQAYVN